MAPQKPQNARKLRLCWQRLSISPSINRTRSFMDRDLAQHSPEMAQPGPEAVHSSKMGQHSPKLSQHSSKTDQHSPVYDGSKLVEEEPK